MYIKLQLLIFNLQWPKSHWATERHPVSFESLIKNSDICLHKLIVFDKHCGIGTFYM